MKEVLALAVCLSALFTLGTLTDDQAKEESYRCEMVLLHEKTSHMGYDSIGWPAKDDQELEFCQNLIKQ